MAEGGGSDYRLSATLLLNDQLSGKLRSAASQLKSMDSAASRFGATMNGEVARLARQFGMLTTLRGQVDQFRQMKKAVSATQQAFNQANGATAQLARQYRQGQGVVAQMQAKHDELRKTFDTSQFATAQLKNQLGGMRTEAARLNQSGALDEYKKLQSQIKSTSDQLKASQATTRRTGAELKSLAGGIKLAQGELANIGKAFDQSKAKASRLKQELTQQRPVLDQLRRSLNAQGFSTANFAQSEINLRRRLAETARDIYAAQRQQQLRDTLTAAGMTVHGRTIPVNVSGNATSQLGKIRAQLQSLTGKAWNVAINAKNALGTKFNDFAMGAAMGLGLPFLGTAGVAYGGIDIIKTYKDFEYEMATVSAITGAYRDESGKRLAELTDLAKKYGETTMFKASEVASAEKYMGFAGWSDESIKAGLKPLLDLAAASGEDLRRTSDIVTDAMTAMHLRPEETYKLSNGKFVNATEHFADVMAAMATSSNTDVSRAGEAAKYSGAIIGAMYSDQGIQDRMRAYEDWAILTGSMANAGIKDSMAGTATRAIFTRLSSMQRNAEAAREVLGVDLVYDKDDSEGHLAGQMRAPLEILNDIRDKFQNGFASADELMNTIEFFDESGKKFTKVQRTKIGEMLKNAQKNGGKLSKKDVLSMANMLAGMEAMSGLLAYVTADEKDLTKVTEAIRNSDGRAKEMADVKIDTLAGDLATLASAWEALNLELMRGKGGEGFRNFTKGLTDDIRAFKKAIADGFDIGDIGSLLARVATQLKNKFLEFDGVGSILAGGALIMGMKKIYDWALKLRGAAAQMGKWWMGAAATMNGRQTALPPATARAGVGVPSSVGSMVVNAGSVVVNGKVAGGAAAATGGKPSTVIASGNPKIAAVNQARVTDHYRERAKALNALPPTYFPGWKGAAGGGAAFAGIFAAMDIFSTRSINETRLAEAQETIDARKKELQVLQDSGAEQEHLNQQVQLIREAEAERNKIIAQNQIEMDKTSGGAIGAVLGTALGSALGTFAGPIGTVIGGMALGMLGQKIGEFYAPQLVRHQEFSPKAADTQSFVEKYTSEKFLTPKFGFEKPEETSTPQKTITAPEPKYFGEYTPQKIVTTTSGSVADFSRLNDSLDNFQARMVALDAQAAREKKMSDSRILTDDIRRATGGRSDWFPNQPMPEVYRAKATDLAAQKDSDVKTLEFKTPLRSDQSLQPATQQFQTQPTIKVPEIKLPELKLPKLELSEQATRIRSDQSLQPTTQQFQTQPAIKLPEFNFSAFIDDLFGFKRAAASAEFTPEQLAQRDAMERGEFYQPQPAATEAQQPEINLEGLFSQFEGFGQGVTEIFSTLGTSISEGLTTTFTSVGEQFSTFGTSITEGLTTTFTSVGEQFSTFGTSITEGFTTAFTGVGETFTGLGEQMSAGLETARATAEASLMSIKTSFDSGLQEIQSAWGALPGFFDGIFSGLGGAASAAGAAIAAGLTSPIGTVIGAWQSAASTISSIISSISAQAANAGSMVPSVGAVGHNATGTVSWRGGFTEINEHGGEIINLPSGTKIFPHATTMKMLQREIQNGTFNEFVSEQNPSNFVFDSGTQFSTFPQAFQFGDLSTFPSGFEFGDSFQTETNNSSSTTKTTTTNSGVTISGNTFHIRKETDLDEIAFRLFELMTDSNANYAGA